MPLIISTGVKEHYAIVSIKYERFYWICNFFNIQREMFFEIRHWISSLCLINVDLIL